MLIAKDPSMLSSLSNKNLKDESPEGAQSANDGYSPSPNKAQFLTSPERAQLIEK